MVYEMKKKISIPTAVVRVQNPEEAIRWFCEHFGFETLVAGKRPGVVLGNIKILFERSKVPETIDQSNGYFCGAEHIALNTGDIRKAMEHCRKEGLSLIADGSEPFFNPQVFGDGEWYVNVENPMGIKLEISSKVHEESQEQLFTGLDHIGVPCGDFEKEIGCLEQLGFKKIFEPVENDSEYDGKIRCVMMEREGMVLEVYQFLDQIPDLKKEGNIVSLIWNGGWEQTPSGVVLEPEDDKGIMALGECLIDVLCKEKNGRMSMEGNPGGAPANVLAMAAKLGISVSMISRVGQDELGNFMKRHLRKAQIGCGFVGEDKDSPTTLAMVTLDEKGDRSFAFYRNETADVRLDIPHLPLEPIRQSAIFHFGSVSMTTEPAAEATITAAKEAKKAGVIVSYDPNLRPLLWKNQETAKKKILEGMEWADLVKVSEEELTFLTGEQDMEKGAEILYQKYNPRCLVVTLGEKGCICRNAKGFFGAKAYQTGCIDTTGAGDAFWGAFLGRILNAGKCMENMEAEEIQDILKYSCAAGSLATAKKGAIPAVPSDGEIRDCMNRGKLIE